jgi:hypothetical protein
VSQTQASGLLFSSATAAEWRRRADIVRPLVTLDDWSPSSRSPTCAARLAPVALSAVQGVCARATGLTGVVLDRPVVGGAGMTVFARTPEPIACTTRDRLDIRRVSRLTYLPCAGLAPH